MRLLAVEERSAFADATLEPIDVENEEQGLVGFVVVVARKSGARRLKGDGADLVLSVSGLGVGALGENVWEFWTPEDDARLIGLTLDLRGDCASAACSPVVLVCRDGDGEAEFEGLPRPRLRALPVSLAELDEDAIVRGTSSSTFHFFVAPEVGATTISSPMLFGSGRRSLGMMNLEKKDVIFWLPDGSFLSGAIEAR